MIDDAAYDWYTDPGTTGAFAYFGPGQLTAIYPWIANRKTATTSSSEKLPPRIMRGL